MKKLAFFIIIEMEQRKYMHVIHSGGFRFNDGFGYPYDINLTCWNHGNLQKVKVKVKSDICVYNKTYMSCD